MDRKALKVIGQSKILILKKLLLKKSNTQNENNLILLMIIEQWNKLDDVHAEILEENPSATKLHAWLDDLCKSQYEITKELMESYKEWRKIMDEEDEEEESEAREPQTDYNDRD